MTEDQMLSKVSQGLWWSTNLMASNQEGDQLIPDILRRQPLAGLWISAFQHGIQKIAMVFTTLHPVPYQLS